MFCGLWIDWGNGVTKQHIWTHHRWLRAFEFLHLLLQTSSIKACVWSFCGYYYLVLIFFSVLREGDGPCRNSVVGTSYTRSTEIGKGRIMFYPSPLRTSGDASGSVKGMLIPSFPGSDPTGKWAPCASGCPAPSKASCSALLCVRETDNTLKINTILAVEGSPGSNSSPSAWHTFMYLASVGIQVFQCLKEAECTALVNWSYISVHEMSSFGSWRGSHTIQQQCCCLHTIGNQGFPFRIARPGGDWWITFLGFYFSECHFTQNWLSYIVRNFFSDLRPVWSVWVHQFSYLLGIWVWPEDIQMVKTASLSSGKPSSEYLLMPFLWLSGFLLCKLNL